MTTPEAPPSTRRAARSRPVEPEQPDLDPLAVFSPVDEPVRSGLALTWLDDDAVTARGSAHEQARDAGPYTLAHVDLLAQRPHRSPLRTTTVVPALSVAALVAAGYAAATLLWPLHAVAPEVTPVAIAAPVAAVAAPAWPTSGMAATAVDGLGTVAASAADPETIASITKLVTALMVLDQHPLEVGASGPEFSFTAGDRQEYLAYTWDGQSALDVPAGATLSQLQLLQGVLIGSANNYADRLVDELWPSRGAYVSDANAWLSQHGLGGVEVTDPSGIGSGNTADPAAVIALARAAMAQPVIAGIVGTASIDLPGAGLVENTNPLLATPGVVGVKTGSLWEYYNLVVAQDTQVAGQTVRAYAAVMGQPDPETRDAATAALLAQTIAEVEASPVVPAGTLAGTVTTAWGAASEVRTATDARVALWNGQVADAAVTLDLDDLRAAGDEVGTLTIAGPLGSATAAVELVDDVPDPDAWWRLTHPLHLWGLAG